MMNKIFMIRIKIDLPSCKKKELPLRFRSRHLVSLKSLILICNRLIKIKKKLMKKLINKDPFLLLKKRLKIILFCLIS